MYTPQSIKQVLDTTLDDELSSLVELLAAGVHDSWAYNRMEQGWRYGKTLERDSKTHPSLVPYEQLPESEKNVDRDTVETVLKILQQQGYCIKPKSD